MLVALRRRFFLHKPLPLPPLDPLPGISIVKPLMGVDSELEGNLESHFQLKYGGPLELLLCVQDPNDPAIDMVKTMCDRYPEVDCRLFVGEWSTRAAWQRVG